MRIGRATFAFLMIAAVAAGAAAGQTGPRVKWRFAAASPVYSSPMVADLDGDGRPEIVIIASATRKVIALRADGKEMWRAGSFRQRLTATPTVAQLDRAGGPEILVPSRDRGLVCLGADGRERWQTEVGGWLPWQSAVVADLEGDGAPEAYIGTDRFMMRLAPDGAAVWRTELPAPGAVGANLIAAGDVNGDGDGEIIVPAGWGGLVCLSASGAVLWAMQDYSPISQTPVIADIDGDKRTEVICGTDDGIVYAIDGASGAIRWSQRTSAGGVTSSIAVADADGDGTRETVYSDTLGFLHCIGADGLERWAWDMGATAEGAPAIGDVDGDGAREILAGIGTGDLVCCNPKGDVKWRYPTGKRIVSSPTVTDVDGDGIVEILLTGHDGFLHCLTMGGRYDPSLVPWPMTRFDSGQTGWVR